MTNTQHPAGGKPADPHASDTHPDAAAAPAAAAPAAATDAPKEDPSAGFKEKVHAVSDAMSAFDHIDKTDPGSVAKQMDADAKVKAAASDLVDFVGKNSAALKTAFAPAKDDAAKHS